MEAGEGVQRDDGTGHYTDSLGHAPTRDFSMFTFFGSSLAGGGCCTQFTAAQSHSLANWPPLKTTRRRQAACSLPLTSRASFCGLAGASGQLDGRSRARHIDAKVVSGECERGPWGWSIDIWPRGGQFVSAVIVGLIAVRAAGWPLRKASARLESTSCLGDFVC